MTPVNHVRRRAGWVALLAALVPLSACDTPNPSSPTPTTSSPSPTGPTSTPTRSPTPTPTDPLAGLSLEQRVGQLFMVGVDVASPQAASRDAVSDRNVGNVFLAGRSSAGVDATADLVESFTSLVSDATTGGLPMFVATDQEGGNVQVLRGPGFSSIPSALDQAPLGAAQLRDKATAWAAELAAAGINLNLGPVMDVVPSPDAAENNPPIGRFDRQYGYTTADVAVAANAFSAGMMASGVDVTIKHFPGLGRVTTNTDTAADVRDTVTTRDDPYLTVFSSGIDAGAAFVMMSTAYYTRIDPDNPAAFSRTLVTDVLRSDLGFDGVVMTDDVSAAEQVQRWAPAERAIRSIAAGVDMVLVSADPTLVAEMVDAVAEQARSDPSFAARVDESATRVLAAKAPLR